mgnify:CR=1 FL=1
MSRSAVRTSGGSSPLSRGIPAPRCRQCRPRRIIPALAGNTSRAAWMWGSKPDHPRSRGEYGGDPAVMYPRRGSSPLSRGIPSPPAAHRVHVRIIPALAGNTPIRLVAGGTLRDHPRSRGEYWSVSSRRRSSRGSSPLSRGIPPKGCGMSDLLRIIPALAGNTLLRPAGSSSSEDHPRSRGEYS